MEHITAASANIIVISIMKIGIKVAPKPPLLGKFKMLKASGTFATDCCKEQAILLLLSQKHTLKSLRLLKIRFSCISVWKSRGQLGGVSIIGTYLCPQSFTWT